ncbi:MAG: tripartite tricarboxylate transporter substrate binding protein [Gammaproteobacteria bacterium]|nr:tripartite tricarboxylate transporter substrate binding protein [Gammaproteobacteria bacterium]
MKSTIIKKAGSLVLGLTASALLLGATGAAQAEYPDRPIGVMVAYNPGGATDFQARIATLASAKEADGKAISVGQPIYVTNKPGAGGRKGWNWFAEKASKDGYMMAAYNVPHFIAQSIVFDTKYNINNLEPVGNWGADPAVLIVGKDSKFSSATELVEYAKANPGKVTVSGAGKFVGHHIAHLQFEKAANVKLKYVPGKGGVGAMKLVKGGQVMAGFNNLSDSARAQGDIKILAVADLERHAFLPDVPTFKELGIPVDNSSVNFRGLMVPKGTPDSVIKHLANSVPKMFNDKKTLGKMKQTNSPVRIMTRDEVISMWKERQVALTELLEHLK